ncbi:MAG TPA: glycosyltransferase family 2 protein [Stellaceae bacterium]|nr:glycosyltransferase family 2 protein [Stellaceae bacterium]
MRIVKQSRRERPLVSLIFLDWSVRESFHVLHYLKRQSVPRDAYETIVIEFYGRESSAIGKFADEVDTWVILDMPETACYHKHLMYNVGIVMSRGEIVMIGDSDAMVTERFIERIVEAFRAGGDIVYHMDQFRNLRRDFYPFSYPTFAEVTGPGCINNDGGKTAGIRNLSDPIHVRNYGACMCARRADLIAIGGADEHIDYLGHVCGPYDMTFRLVNFGRREVWAEDEFMYHTWHPGQAGVFDYMGPHDGRQLSSTATEALATGRVAPLVENRAIALLRSGVATSREAVLDELIDARYAASWERGKLTGEIRRTEPGTEVPLGRYKAHRLAATEEAVRAYFPGERVVLNERPPVPRLEAAERGAIERAIDARTPRALSLARSFARFYVLVFALLHAVALRAKRLPGPLPESVKAAILLPIALLLLPFLLLLFPRRLARSIPTLLADTRQAANALGDIAIGARDLHQCESGTPLLAIVGSVHALFFLAILRFLNLMPACALRLAKTVPEMARILGDLERASWPGRILLADALLARFHQAALGSPLQRRLVIV